MGVKRCTVPNQSLSLKQILQRFVRREALPIEHAGVFEDRFGDLEKLKYADIFDRQEKAKELKVAVDAFNEKVAAKQKEELELKLKAERQAIIDEFLKANPPGGVEPVKSPAPKGP